LRVFGKGMSEVRWYAATSGATGVLLILGFLQSNAITSLFENRLYQDEIIYSEQTLYQRIVVTTYQEDLRLFLDRELQFSSRDEYRYHEPLVHPAMSLTSSREHVLIIGGGDGLAAREVLKYADVQRVTLVDIDVAVTRLGQTFGPIVALNTNSLNDTRLKIINQDGYKFLADSSDLYQVIIADLPDPRSESFARLFSHDFYGLVKRHLAQGGIFVTQSSSPYFVRQAYWCIAHTIASAGLEVQTYHTYIPTFGDWGFVVASNLKIDWGRIQIGVPTHYLKNDLLGKMITFDPDTAEVPTDISTLENPAVWRYYLEGWRRWRA
jgi:spermidine synthase